MIKSAKNRKIIAIIGLMGVGKTTLGSKLAERLGYYFIDSDVEIEDREGSSIAEIFFSKGEKYFRQREVDVIEEIIARDEPIVLSLGGGAFMNEKTREILQQIALVIWLQAPLDNILHRLSGKNNRPLLVNKNRRQILEDLAEERYPIYSLADFKVVTKNNDQEIAIDKILNFLKYASKNRQ